MKARTKRFNRLQRIAADAYGGGDYRGYKNMAEVNEANASGNIGDGLFVFILQELSDVKRDEGIERLETAIADLLCVQSAIMARPR